MIPEIINFLFEICSDVMGFAITAKETFIKISHTFPNNCQESPLLTTFTG